MVDDAPESSEVGEKGAAAVPVKGPVSTAASPVKAAPSPVKTLPKAPAPASSKAPAPAPAPTPVVTKPVAPPPAVKAASPAPAPASSAPVKKPAAAAPPAVPKADERESLLLQKLKGKMQPPVVKKAAAAAAASTSSSTKEAEPVPRVVPPPSTPVICTLRVDGFVRPFRQPAAKDVMVAVGGALGEGGFWMDAIKTHCYATFVSEGDAVKARAALYNRVWPERGGTLKAEFADKTAAVVAQEVADSKAARQSLAASASSSSLSERRGGAGAEGGAAATAPIALSNGGTVNTLKPSGALHSDQKETELRRKRELGPSPEAKRLKVDEQGGKAAPLPTLDDLFRSTKTKPKLYWLPLEEEKVAVKRARKEELKGAGAKKEAGGKGEATAAR